MMPPAPANACILNESTCIVLKGKTPPLPFLSSTFPEVQLLSYLLRPALSQRLLSDNRSIPEALTFSRDWLVQTLPC